MCSGRSLLDGENGRTAATSGNTLLKCFSQISAKEIEILYSHMITHLAVGCIFQLKVKSWHFGSQWLDKKRQRVRKYISRLRKISTTYSKTIKLEIYQYERYSEVTRKRWWGKITILQIVNAKNCEMSKNFHAFDKILY